MGDNKEGELKKRCPFNNEWCGDWCPLLVTVNRVVNGVVSQAAICSFVANFLMISEINMKTMLPQQQRAQQKIVLPGLFGKG